MRRIVLSLVLLIGVALAASGSVLAGGWATVRLDAPVSSVAAGVPFAFGFTIRQHDINPINVERATVFARPQDGGTSMMAEATQEGAEGHYVAELTLPSAGGWKWGIDAGEPWGEMAFETLAVSAAGASAATKSGSDPGVDRGPWTAVLSRGSCAEGNLQPVAEIGAIMIEPEGETAGNAAPQRLSSKFGPKTAVPVGRTNSIVPISLDDVARSDLVLVVEEQGSDDTGRVACGDVGGGIVDDEVVFGLAEQDDSGYIGIGRLHPLGERTDIAVYLMSARPASAETTAEVTIDDAAFSPPTLTVPVGATVTWRNEGLIAHSVSGGDLAFADSAVLDPGRQFVQTFDAPGTYQYVCSPHPSMTGIITVE